MSEGEHHKSSGQYDALVVSDPQVARAVGVSAGGFFAISAAHALGLNGAAAYPATP